MPPKASPRATARKPPHASKATTIHPAQRKFLFPLFLVGGGFFFYASYHISSAYVQLKQPARGFEKKKVDLTRVYNDTAEGFDNENDRIEYWWGIMKLRQKLLKSAEGHVLESAVGTGRNLEFYDRNRIKSLLMVDRSEGMLGICRDKWDITHRGENWAGRVKFWVGDLEVQEVQKHVVPLVNERQVDDGFDTIVQTMGLCSTEDPEGLLRSLGKLVKDDGKIMLLEHGKSHYDWLNRLLDQTASQHATMHGCWWNRDIGDIVKRSGLEVVQLKRHTLGTTWWVELKRPKEDVQRDVQPPEGVKDLTGLSSPHIGRQPSTKSWWEIWK
jgi:methyltransferase OMS1